MSITYPEKLLPTIAIVGRTNVGKSTLFNRLTEKRKALISPLPGTTRTSNIAEFLWRGEKYRLIDTGGLDFEKKYLFEKEIKKQIEKALSEAQVIIFLVDLRTGLLPQEKEWTKKMLRHLPVPIILAGNKADNLKIRHNVYDKEWKKLGFGEPLPISAANGSGVGDLLDEVIKTLEHLNTETLQQKNNLTIPPIRVSIIGRPNVGKSTLFNALIGEERVIVSPVPHTTRESHDTLILKDNEPFLFVDTAGIRRHSRIEKGLEQMGVGQAVHSLQNSDLALLVLDASEPFKAQDKQLVGLIADRHKGLIIIVNKWDLVEDRGEENRARFLEEIFYYFPFLRYAPVLFVSAKTHLKVHQMFKLIKEINQSSLKTIEESTLRDFMKKIIRIHRPARGKGVRHPRISSLKQIDTAPPTFQVTIKQKTSLHESYLKFIENQLRQEFGFEGTPVIVYAKKVKI